MTKAIDLCSPYWTDYYKSQTPSAIVDGVELLMNSVRFPGPVTYGRIYPLVIKSDELFETTFENRTAYAFPLSCPFTPSIVYTSMSSPSHVWLENADFSVYGGLIYFYQNPFNQDEVLSKTKQVGSDRQSVLWLSETPDLNTERAKFAGAFDALLDTVEEIYDAPVVRISGTVREVTALPRGTVVVTDYEAFSIPTNSTVSVSVGDEVNPGDSVCGAWRFIKLGPLTPDEPSVAIPASRLVGSLSGDLVWHNTPTATVVDSVGGKTRIRWALGGSGGNVTAFWASVHQRALDGYESLAEALDRRPTPSGQPSAFDLPISVNPAQVLCEWLLRGSVYIVEVDESQLGPDALTNATERQNRLKAVVTPSTGIFEYTSIPTTAAVLP